VGHNVGKPVPGAQDQSAIWIYEYIVSCPTLNCKSFFDKRTRKRMRGPGSSQSRSIPLRGLAASRLWINQVRSLENGDTFSWPWWDRHLACHFLIDRRDAFPTDPTRPGTQFWAGGGTKAPGAQPRVSLAPRMCRRLIRAWDGPAGASMESGSLPGDVSIGYEGRPNKHG
jgi:hypothetical protein